MEQLKRSIMKMKFLAAAFAVSFVMVACDSDSSTEPSEKVINDTNLSLEANSSDTETTSSSSEGTGSIGETPTSSADNAPASDAGTAPASSAGGVVPGIGTGSSSSVDLSAVGLTQEQYELLKALSTQMGDSDGADGGSAAVPQKNECQNGDLATTVVQGQDVQWTCIYGDWIPTSGFDKVIESLSPEQLDVVTARTGLTKEQLVAMFEFLSQMDVSKDSAEMYCEGELTDNFWKLNMTGTFAGVEFLMKGDVTFDGDSMITNRTMEMDMGSESVCQTYLNTPDDEDEDDAEEAALDKMRYGDVVETKSSCNGSRMVETEKMVNKNVTDESRSSAYEDMIGHCKDYRDGKVTFEDLMMAE